jgi:8-oxo-dGTP pyrophosphatase MutT (NUDIX family)
LKTLSGSSENRTLMTNFNIIVDRIRDNLTKELPGKSAQQKMSPSFRAGVGFPTSPNSRTRQSAVLISIYPDNGIAKTILIKRTVYKGAHSGQVSFPGGKMDSSDKSIIDTALREANEEVGIDQKSVEVLGSITPLFIPVSNLLVTPVIGVINEKPHSFYPNLHEVEYIIDAFLNDFKDPNKISEKTIKVAGFIPIIAPFYSINNEFVWGATAMIISEFTEIY